MKLNSLSLGTIAESRWESSSEEELFLKQSSFTAKSEKHDGKYLLSVAAIPLVFRNPIFLLLLCNEIIDEERRWKMLRG